jgi:hypothetical protein
MRNGASLIMKSFVCRSRDGRADGGEEGYLRVDNALSRCIDGAEMRAFGLVDASVSWTRQSMCSGTNGMDLTTTSSPEQSSVSDDHTPAPQQAFARVPRVILEAVTYELHRAFCGPQDLLRQAELSVCDLNATNLARQVVV